MKNVFCFGAILMGMTVSIAVAVADEPKVVTEEFVFESAPFPQCHASTIAQTRDSVLVAAWFGGTKEKNPDVGIWLSRKEGERWSEPVEIANGIQYTRSDGSVYRHPCWNPVLFQPADGPLMLFYKVGPNPESWWGMLTTSDDGGKTWSPRCRLPEHIDGPVKNKPVQLPSGTILCGCSTENDGWRVHFESTDDYGVTWSRTGPINDGETIEAIQPSVLFLPGDRLLTIGRTRQDRVFLAESPDWGKSWNPMTLGLLPNPNSGTDAVTLSDGRHLLVYNHVPGEPGRWGGKRSPLNVAIADADAKDWNPWLELEHEPKAEFSYPAIIQTTDGLVHITYTWKRQRIKHVVIDPGTITKSH